VARDDAIPAPLMKIHRLCQSVTRAAPILLLKARPPTDNDYSLFFSEARHQLTIDTSFLFSGAKPPTDNRHFLSFFQKLDANLGEHTAGPSAPASPGEISAPKQQAFPSIFDSK